MEAKNGWRLGGKMYRKTLGRFACLLACCSYFFWFALFCFACLFVCNTFGLTKRPLDRVCALL